MSGLLGRLIQGGGLSLVKIVCGLLKLKVLAATLGIADFGVLSLLLQSQNVMIALISMGLSLGVINLGRPRFSAGRIAESGQVAGTAAGLVGINAIAFLMLFLTFGDDVKSHYLGRNAHELSIWPIAVAAVCASFAGGFWEGILFLTSRFDLYVRSSMAAAVVDALLFMAATILFGLTGAVYASMLSAIGLLIAFTVAGTRSKESRLVTKAARFQFSYVRPLLGFGTLMLATTALSNIFLFLARSRIVATVGPEENGLLQVSTTLAAYFLPFLTTGIHGHLFPIAAAHGDTDHVRTELRKTIDACVPVASAGCIGIVLTAPLVVPIIYSRAFSAGLAYLSFYFIGEFLFIIGTIYGIYLLAINEKRAYFLGTLVYSTLLFAGVAIDIASTGAWSYVISHIAGAGVIVIIIGVTAVRGNRLNISTLVRIAFHTLAVALVGTLTYLEHKYNYEPWLSWSIGAAVIVSAVLPLAKSKLKGTVTSRP